MTHPQKLIDPSFKKWCLKLNENCILISAVLLQITEMKVVNFENKFFSFKIEQINNREPNENNMCKKKFKKKEQDVNKSYFK